MKECRGCRQAKPIDCFNKDRSRSDGLSRVCRECAAAYQRARNLAEPERNRSRVKSWQRNNPEKRNAKSRAWSARNHDRRKQISRESALRRYWSDPDTARRKGVILAKRFRTQNPEAFKAIAFRARNTRRARQLGSEKEPVDYWRITQRDRMVCHICKTPVRSKSELEFDHVIPLAKGGPHVETNIAVSHRRCNRQKAAKVLTLF